METNNAAMSERLDQLHRHLKELREQMKATTQQDQISSLFEAMAKDALETSTHCLLRKRGERVISSLKFDKISERKSNIPAAHKKTFQWALSGTTTTLPEWLRSGDGVYWIEGKAGSGKSTLMKFLQQTPETTTLLQEWAGRSSLLFVSHYFWAPGTDLQRSFAGLLQTLLFQVFLHDPELMSSVCPSRINTSDYIHLDPWTLQELKECFNRLASMQRLPSKLCVFIDGLDEFQGTPADLIDFVQSISKSSNIKLCVSSRPWVEFSQAFEALPKLHVHELTTEDISRYARDNLESNSHYQHLYTLSPTEAEGLISELINTAQGVFLWVFLAVRDLLRGLQYDDDIPTLRRRLKSLPKHLEEYFERMLVETIDPVYFSETSVLFSILAYTEFPLNTFITWAYRQLQAFERNPATFELTLNRDLPPVEHSVATPSKSVRTVERTADDSASLDGELEYRGLRPPRKGNRDSRKFRAPRDLESFGDDFLNPDDYSPQRERARVLARCKDLVQVGDEIHRNKFTANFGSSITFLHRTVADFFQLPRIKTMIYSRIASLPQSTEFSPLFALAETHLEILWAGRLDPNDQQALIRLILGLAREMRRSSEWAYYQSVHKLTTLSDRPTHGAAMKTVRASIWAVAIERWGMADYWITKDRSEYLSFGLTFHTRGKSGLFPEHSPSQPGFNSLFWTAHCEDCLMAANLSEFSAMLSVAFALKPVTLPDLGTGEEIPLNSQSRQRANLALVRDLMSTKVWRNESEREDAWVMFLNEIQNLKSWPTNLYDGIRIMIQHGAPRKVSVAGFDGALFAGFMAKNNQLGQSQVSVVSLLVLIPAISEHDADGMEQDFKAAESRDEDQTPNRLTSLRSLLGWSPSGFLFNR